MTLRIVSRAILCVATALALFSVDAATVSAQQTGAISGVVADEMSGRPLPGVVVSIRGTTLTTTTNEQGRFLFTTVPAGAQVLQLENLGYATMTRTVTVVAGQTATANISMAQTALALGEIVVTGVSGGGVERGKVPFAVSRVDLDQMPVQGISPLSQIQGRVPGANIAATSGRPGRSPDIILRGPTSINASGRGQGPLIIVDGIVLGSDIADLNPADIESVEVVKGAAASTLFGSRAAAGVIQITTRRGTNEGVQFSMRSEIGFNDIERDFGIARHHALMLDETGTRFCVQDSYGTAGLCSRTIDWETERRRVNENPEPFSLAPPSFPVDPGAVTSGDILRRAFVAGNWIGPTFNAVNQFVDPKPLTQNDFSMAGRLGLTNFFASVGHTRQAGAIAGLDGYRRANVRLNLGHRVGTAWSFDVTSYVSRAQDDGASQEEGSAAFFRLTRQPAIVDLTTRDQAGRPYIRSNLFNAGSQNFNPIYWNEEDQREDVRWRSMVGATVGYTPFVWLQTDANLSVDRYSNTFSQFRNKGFRTTTAAIATNEGLLFNGVTNNQSMNSTVGATLIPQFSDILNTRFTLRALYEEQDFDSRNFQGNRLRVRDITSAANATVLQTIASSQSQTRQLGLSAGGFFDLLDRYTFDFAIRRDGSSRFGDEHRWQTYGRASAAWLMAREEWFPSDFLSVFTLRGSYGTAGNVPSFAAQYETFNLGAGGTLTAATLGNPLLRPEVVKEIEVGADIEIMQRFGLSLTYANSLAQDQIMPVPVSIATGFPNQWQNAGDMRNQTWEAALTVPVLRRQGFSWMTRATYMQNQPMVETLGRPPFFIGTNLQATDAIMRIEEGVRYGTFFGRRFMRSCSELPAQFQAQCGRDGSAFQANDEGYIVWVGEGNNPNMGITHNMWNAVLPQADGPCGARGVVTSWGMPMLYRDWEGTCAPQLVPLGHTLPDWRMGIANNIQFRGLSLYGLVEGAFGHSVWNQGRHWAHLDFLARELDQVGKSVEAAKPIGYYYRAGPGPSGGSGIGGFYDVLGPNNHTVEDASWVKIREVSASYNVGRLNNLGLNLGDWTVSLIGRNLLTFTDYKGFDPEVGIGNNTTNQAGSSLVNAVDAFTFPQLRTFSFVLQSNF
jgi:TonB-linked SusC/RagA family outer membrane protein